jgi:hypothetical protein
MKQQPPSVDGGTRCHGHGHGHDRVEDLDRHKQPDPNDPSSSSSWILIKKGQFAKVGLDFQPDICTFTLCRQQRQRRCQRCQLGSEDSSQREEEVVVDGSGDDDDDEEFNDTVSSALLLESLQRLLNKYPVLRGRIIKSRRGGGEYWVQQNYFSNDAKDYYDEIDGRGRSDLQLPSDLVDADVDLDENEQDYFEFMDQKIIPTFSEGKNINNKVLTVTQRAKRCLPLFGMQVLLLDNGYFCYSVMLCHAIGDAPTYYQLLHEISQSWGNCNNSSSGVGCSDHTATATTTTTTTTLNWNNELVITKEIADHPRDIDTVSGLPMAIGFIRSAIRLNCSGFNFGWCTRRRRTAELEDDDNDDDDNGRFYYLIIDKNKVNGLKQELKDDDVEFLSTNDVLTSRIFQAFFPSNYFDLIMVSRNDRNRIDDDSVGPYDAGCYFSVVPLPRLDDPNDIRRTMNQGYYYPIIPRQPIFRGRFIMMTSWATAQRNLTIIPPTTKTDDQNQRHHYQLQQLAHIPHPSFVRDLPFAMIVVSQYSHNTLLVMHNIPKKAWDKQGMAQLQSLC